MDGYDQSGPNPSSPESRRHVYHAGADGLAGAGAPRPPGGPGRSRRSRTAVAVTLVVVLAAAGLAAYLLIRGSGPAQSAAHTPSPSPSGSAAAGLATPSAGQSASGSPSPLRSAAGSPSPSPAWPSLATDPKRQSVPILMYHIVAPVAVGATYPGLYVRPADFKRQIRYLHDQGFEAVTLAQVFSAWRGDGQLPAKPVVLSFDDGYRSDYLNAAPIIGQYGWVGVLSVDCKVIDQDPVLGTMIGLLSKMGWEVDSHSLTHPDLTTLNGTALTNEVAGSRTRLQKLYGIPVDFFCYPAGAYNATVEAAVKNAGYLAATTTVDGVASPHDDPYALPRVRVEGGMTLSAFAAAVNRGL